MKTRYTLLLFTLLLFLGTGAVKAQAPTLDSPSDGSTYMSLTPSFVWTQTGTTADFQIQVSTDAGFTGIVIDSTITGDTSYTVPGSEQLAANSTFHWRVYPVGGFGDVSATWDFTTGNIPVLMAPSNNSLHQPINPTLVWSYDGPDPDYRVQIATSSSFGTIVIDTLITGGDTTYTVPDGLDLSHNTYYYWRVIPADEMGLVSNTWRFRTVRQLIPLIGAPLNHAHVYTTNALLTWYFNQAWTGFEFEVRWSTTDSTLTTFTSVPGLTLTTHSLPLTGGLTYWWQVVVVHPTTGAIAGSSVISEFHAVGPGHALTPIPSYPLTGHVVYTHAPTLYWYVNGYAAGVTYDVEIKLSSDAWGAATTYSTANFNVAVSGLNPLSSYDWRVTATGGNGSFTSTVQTFTTADFPTVGGGGGGATLGAPSPTFPINGYVTLDNTPTLYWFLSGNPIGLSFEIDIATTSGGLDGTPEFTGISDLWFEIPSGSALLDDQEYYWSIRWFDGSSYSAWSAYEDFKTPPAAPPVTVMPSYPTGGVTVYTNAPYLFWYTTGLSVGLTFDIEVKLASDPDWTTPAVTGSTSDYFFKATGLTGGETYEWRVSADGGVTWTTAESFVVNGASGALPVPVLDYPLDGSNVYVHNPLVVWHVVGVATGVTYELEYQVQGSGWGAPTSVAVSNTFYQMPSLTPGVTYEWRVRSVDGVSVPSAWATGSFTIYDGGGGSVPVSHLSYPLNAGTVYVTNPFLIWYVTSPAIGATYTLQYATASDFSAGLVEITGITNIFEQISGLTPGQTYWWRVETFIGATGSGWSSTYSFTVEGTAFSPVTPAVGGPSGGSMVADLNPEISWFSPAPNQKAVTYELQYATNRDMIDATVNEGLTEFSQEIDGLEPGTTYFWRVRAIDEDGHSSGFSDVASFTTTGEVTGVDDKDATAALPDDFALEQNYPNPFNPSTNINFAIPEAGMVSLRVYNILGQEVAALVNESMPAGFHTVRFNAANLSTGVYIYRIDAGKFTSMKKMILMK